MDNSTILQRHRSFAAIIRSASILAAVASAAPLRAQDTPPTPDASAAATDVIVVTAARTRNADIGILGNRDTLDTPFSVSSFSNQAILNAQARRLYDILQEDPSISTNRIQYDFAELLTVRGFDLYLYDAGRMDGLRSAIGDRTLPFEIFETITFLRGPDAVLSGNVASPSGSIYIRSKRAPEEPLTRLVATYNSDTVFGATADVARRFGPDGQFGVRAIFSKEKGETFTEGLVVDKNFAGASFDFRASRVRLSAHVFQRDNSFDGFTFGGVYLPEDGSGLPRVPNPRRSVEGSNNLIDNKKFSWWGTAEADLTEAITLKAAYGRSTFKSQEIFSVSLFRGIDAAGNAEASAFQFLTDTSTKSGNFGAEAEFSTAGISHKLVVNYVTDIDKGRFSFVDYGSFITNVYNPPDLPRVTTIPPPADSFSDAAPRDHRSYGFADTLTMLDDRLTLLVGLRRQTIEQQPYKRSGWLFSGAGLFKFADNASLFANYAESLEQGARAPDFGVSNPGEVFAPASTQQFEIGAKADLFDTIFTLAAFQITRPRSFIEPIILRFSQEGEQRHRGLEFSFFGSPIKGTRFTGGLSYIDAKITRSDDPLVEGTRAPGVSKWQLKLGVEYDVAAVDGLTAVGSARYQSSQSLIDPTVAPMSGFTLFDAGLRYRHEIGDVPMSFNLLVRNIADKRYYSGIQSGTFAVIGSPRTASLSWQVDF